MAVLALSGRCVAAAPSNIPSLVPYNVVWTTPSDDSRGSMPLGNGEIGVNAWVEKSGDLVFYLSKTDAWGNDVFGSYGLPKVGRVRVRLDPNPLSRNAPFRQTLRLHEGDIQIEAGDDANKVTLALWVDAHRPVIHLEGTSAKPTRMQISIDTYRTKAEHGLNPDVLVDTQTDSVAWYQRDTNRDVPPLANRTFGALINGERFTRSDTATLKTASPQKRFQARIYPFTAQTETPEAWCVQIKSRAEADRRTNEDAARRRHLKWWQDYWNRSWVIASGTDDARNVTQGYLLQRFITACSGRGEYPIKFNGSIFTTDYEIKHRDDRTKQETVEQVNADYRTWGGQYWFQNTRAMYWPMLQSGEFEMMRPLFQMYRNQLPVNQKAVRDLYHHDGAYFQETSPFWGGLPKILASDSGLYTRHYYSPILELSTMMFDYYRYTGDRAFVRDTLVPIADAGVTFYDQHFNRDSNGKLDIDPANSIETYWKVKNPAPDVAGLRCVLSNLLTLPGEGASPAQRDHWRKLLGELPNLPMGMKNGKNVLTPFESAPDPGIKNSENPELYAVYPYRIYGLGKPDLTLARDTFAVRVFNGAQCWRQDPIQAAYLGDAAVAQKGVTQDFSPSSKDSAERFPAFWGPFNDYTPDEDNGGNGVHALQLMLLQSEEKKLIVLPAWPPEWNASFKLHAPFNTVVQGIVQGGKLASLTVTPKSRRKDVYFAQPDGTLTSGAIPADRTH